MIPGIDIASYQQGEKGIDWPAVAKYLLGLHPEAFVIIKLCEGLSYVNPFFNQQRLGAEAAGIKNIGLYTYLKPSEGSGAAHADFFFKTLGDYGGVHPNEFYCGDFEDNEGIAPTADLGAFTLDFDQRIAAPAGFHPVLYSSPWYLDPHQLNRDPRLAQMGLWYAAPNQSTIPAIPEPWKSAGKSILLWQYNWHGHVPGIEGEVDLDWLVGPIETLRPFQWGYQADPLAGQLAEGTPDVAVDPKSESVLDANAAFLQIVKDAIKARSMVTRGSDIDAILATIQADAGAGARVTWSH